MGARPFGAVVLAGVAHTTVRRDAPLCSYLLGAAVGAGGGRGQRAAELADQLRSVLPEAPRERRSRFRGIPRAPVVSPSPA